MPPMRNIPPAKVVKTERTHEENQERAYIAASRRSDRSLEARVESARRASEIHKRRTGRSLRVTEQDVINEEMYEEEDADLPMQYRRMTAHLQTNSADFNRRLGAYLTNQIAMRSALGQGIINAYAEGVQNGQFPTNGEQQPFFPSPMLAHQQQQQQQQQIMPAQLQQQPNNPSASRQAPYPSTSSQYHHSRSASIATPQNPAMSARHSPIVPNLTAERRNSMPAVKTEALEGSSATGTQSPLSATATTAPPRPSFPQGYFSQQNTFNVISQNNYNMAGPYGTGTGAGPSNFDPFSMQLPRESQQLLAGSMTLPHDSFAALMMQGSGNFNVPGEYPYHYDTMHDPNDLTKGHHQQQQQHQQQMYPTAAGLNSTLGFAPASLDMQPRCGYDVSASSHGFAASDSFFDQAIDFSGGEPTPLGTPGGGPGGGAGAAGAGAGGDLWTTFIENDRWEAPTSSR